MAIFCFKSGNYPTTMQAYFDRFDNAMYEECKSDYLKLSSNIIDNGKLEKITSHELNEKDFKFYLNFSAYIILDKKNQVFDFAFTEFHDLVWILQIINKDIFIDIPDVLLPELSKDLEAYSDRLVRF